jgi:DNA-binding transcriptional MerR regulator
VLRGKRFGFSLDDIRELLDMYELDDQHQAQLHRTMELAHERLDQMHRQRDDLDAAITELSDQISGGEQMLARLRGASAA